MKVYTKEELLKMFHMCRDLAQYHMEAEKVAFVCNREECDYHRKMIEHYLQVSADIVHITLNGS